MSEEDKGLDIEKLTRAIASELKKLNEVDKPQPTISDNTEKQPKTWNCPDCGATLKGGEKYCPGCGVELEWEP